ncbi:tRNA1(Val) (adenine(37)-N6)-methyltransferase [Parapedobacter pyrenivorans]|uniref:tRNA1(Val) (adenine(37)-N6)-methyltransferase n=1 Tax=Parapedobacter pyrenivorans TaxID=1305674 RepID=UPI00333EA32A
MSVFRFKQFMVDQTGCAMKINTDGVLLGAMAQMEAPKRILDIGTGTGVIALMLAQRFPLAIVDAIEIDAEAARTAGRNFQNSPFADRISCHAVALGDFEPKYHYDLMVSNPPYFLHSLKNQDVRKRIARHADISFFDQLLERSARWLTPKGGVQLILPISLANDVGRQAEDGYGMVVQGAATIRSFSTHPPIRCVLAIGKATGNPEFGEREFLIYEGKGVYSPAYRKLLKDFFLAF